MLTPEGVDGEASLLQLLAMPDAELSETVASDKDLEAERDTLLSILGGDR